MISCNLFWRERERKKERTHRNYRSFIAWHSCYLSLWNKWVQLEMKWQNMILSDQGWQQSPFEDGGGDGVFPLSLAHVASQKNFLQNSRAPSQSPRCSLSAVLVPDLTLLKTSTSTAFHALVLPGLTKGNPLGWCRRHSNGFQEEAWVRTGDYKEPSIKTTPSEKQRENEEGRSGLESDSGCRVWLSNHRQPDPGVSHASEGFLESQLPSRQDESETAHHVQGITADYPMCYYGFKNYKDVLLFQLQKEALKG